MTILTFEPGTLRDGLNNAERVAGRAGDNSVAHAGIVMEIAENGEVHLRSTNQEIFYDEWISATSIENHDTWHEGDKIVWRLAAGRLTRLVQTLPMSAKNPITLDDELGSAVRLRAGRTEATFLRLDERSYPEWAPSHEETLTQVSGFGESIAKIEWACAKEKADGMQHLNGIRIDGKYLVATDRYTIAAVKCPIGVVEPITVPSDQLSMLTKDLGDILVGVVNGYLVVAPTEWNQLRIVPFAESLDGARLLRIMCRDYQHGVDLGVTKARTALDRIGAVGGNRIQALMTLGNEEVVFSAQDDAGVEKVIDTIEVPGQCLHDPIEILVRHEALQQVFTRSKEAVTVALNYDEEAGRKPRIYADLGDYEAWTMELKRMTR